MRVFGARIAALPAPARRQLRVAALQGADGDLRRLRATCPDDPELDGLGEAERAGLVRADETANSVTFTHPLIRATVVQLASGSEQRAAHRSLAAALADHPGTAIWHRVHAAPGPDEALALALEQHAITALSRGDAAGAMAAMQTAADLTPGRAARARRQVQAAFIGADVSGDLNRAIALLEGADALQPEISASLPAAVAASYVLLNGECEVDTAHRLLAEALSAHGTHAPPDSRVLTDALHSLLMMSWFGGRRDLWTPFLEAMARFGDDVAEHVDVVHRMFGDPVHQALETIPRLEQMLETVAEERDPLTITRVALAGVYTDRLAGCREPLWRVIRDGRQGGAVALAINALVSSCVDDWLTGQWDEALELADEGLQMCADYGYRRYSVMLGGYIRQLVRVGRGDTDDGPDVAAEMSQWAASRGAGMALTFSHHLQTLQAIAHDDFEEAYRHLCQMGPPGSLPPYAPHLLWVLYDTVEVCVRTGRIEEARRHVDAMAAAHVERISPRLAMVSAGCAALVGVADDAAAAYEAALAIPDGTRWPFDRARIQLDFGDWLHRHHEPSVARTQEREALIAFASLTARPWIRRAQRQLRATGERVLEASSTPAGGALTDRELDVARLAAAGLTNREIGERLFLSHRSVGAILYRVFPKLGITSRAQLTEALRAFGALGSLSPADPASGGAETWPT
jgi:DNA-binding CsgD family transcriptional regulator